MKKFFMQLPLPRKLMLIAVIPLLCLLYFGFTVFSRQNEDIKTIDRLSQRVANATAIMKVADEIHAERRSSVNYVLQTGSLNDLLTQRAKTDLAIDAVKGRLIASDNRFFQYSLLNTLQKKRKEIDNKIMPQREVLDYYSNLIFRLNELANINTPDLPMMSTIQQDMSAQYLLAQMTAYQGMIRMDIYYFMLKKEVWPEDFSRIENNYDMVNSFRAEFLDKGSPQLVKDFQKLEASNEYRITSDFIKSTIQTRKIDTLFNADSWWDISSQSVDQVKQLQRAIMDKVGKDAKVISKRENDIKTQYIVALVIIVVLVVVFLSITIKSITDSLELLRSSAVNISRGLTGTVPIININTKDAIGSLARSFETIEQTNQDLADAADNIGKGNFNIDIKPRSSEDVLGNAIVKMAADLKVFRKNNDQKIWVQEGLNRISETLLGEKDLPTLSGNALTDIIQYAGAQTGVLYVKQAGQLQLTADYALAPEHKAPVVIELGKTLLGQSLQQREPIYLKETPDDFLHVSTATSDAKPGHVLIIPLVHAGIAEGVIEMGSLYPFGDEVLEFVKQAAVNIAIAIQSTRSRSRLQELLEETQAQAEELQTQHSELESLNVELEAQAQRLQVSEEELKVQQEELMQSNHELEERSKMLEDKNQIIVERNLDIQKKAEELELSTRYKSEFLANMSHELRTPLNSILLLSRLLSENHDKNLNNDQVEYASVINNSGKGLLTLIDEILDLSKIESGKMELEFAEVSIASICNNMQSLFEHIAKDKGLQLSIEVQETVPATIDTDQIRLEQILKNLLSNALKFTAKGDVQLLVKMGDRSDTINFVVRDSGIGIPEDKQQVIFEAFQQADGSTRRKYGGTGLGLSISRELAKLLGGKITVSSEPGKGSEFVVTIPIASEAVENTPVQEIDTTVPEKEETEDKNRFITPVIPATIEDDRGLITNDDKVILIVEDDTYFAKALLDFTRKRGYKGIVTVRGDDAAELARLFKPVGILLDIQLPVKDGWQVMEELKSDPRTRPIPVHIMSSMEARKESLMKGAVDFISKPVDMESMQMVFEKLEFVLQRSTKKVLILEENTKHAKALAYFLSNYQVNSEISSSVSEGIDLLQQKDVDCVILDMGIPDQKAYEALETVKEIKGLEHLPIIIFTGKSLSKTEEQKIRQYADSIVIKTAHSYQRMLDEVSLFLHLVSEQTPSSPSGSGKMGVLNEVLKDKTVLIADDDVRNIFSLTKALELHQMKVLSAIDGKEALQQLAGHKVDVVLMDMMMPEMDGYDAIAAIRKQSVYKNLPIIAVTAKAMMGDREKCLKAGASDYISKPVDVDQLLSLLRVWLYDKSMK
ncbi:response regulator [Chitinophaga silvatica]|uniref:histidine kinase n=1 Tax=Chitinophaga silvatica TaxID=2282649 RepID=A0A3E1Y2S2_9BACT|nr:response regulator [Chitinophaga silvatica]RFS18988.1 response regulator [Chitinophaga silvatica]